MLQRNSNYRFHGELQRVSEMKPVEDRSLDLYYKAAELDPRSPKIGMNLAKVFESRGLYSKAEHQLQEVLELNPARRQYLYTLASIIVAQK